MFYLIRQSIGCSQGFWGFGVLGFWGEGGRPEGEAARPAQESGGPGGGEPRARGPLEEGADGGGVEAGRRDGGPDELGRPGLGHG